MAARQAARAGYRLDQLVQVVHVRLLPPPRTIPPGLEHGLPWPRTGRRSPQCSRPAPRAPPRRPCAAGASASAPISRSMAGLRKRSHRTKMLPITIRWGLRTSMRMERPLPRYRPLVARTSMASGSPASAASPTACVGDAVQRPARRGRSDALSGGKLLLRPIPRQPGDAAAAAEALEGARACRSPGAHPLPGGCARPLRPGRSTPRRAFRPG